MHQALVSTVVAIVITQAAVGSDVRLIDDDRLTRVNIDLTAPGSSYGATRSRRVFLPDELFQDDDAEVGETDARSGFAWTLRAAMTSAFEPRHLAASGTSEAAVSGAPEGCYNELRYDASTTYSIVLETDEAILIALDGALESAVERGEASLIIWGPLGLLLNETVEEGETRKIAEAGIIAPGRYRIQATAAAAAAYGFWSADGGLDESGGATFSFDLALETIACPGDVNTDDSVDFGDLLSLLDAWGPCGICPEDLNGSRYVDFEDLLRLLTAWGPCP